MNKKIRNIKLAALSAFAAVFGGVMLFSDGAAPEGHAAINGPVVARTGAPGEMTCTDCHNPTTGVGTISINAPAAYTPGQTYSIQVRHNTTDTTRKRWGFEMTSLANGVMAGSFANTTANTQIKSNATKSYIEQTQTGTFQNTTGTVVWTFNWTAPATNVGNVTFYAAGIQGNNNGNESGDLTVLKTAVIPYAAPVASTHMTSDFDGDGKTDPAVVRDEAGASVWYARTATGDSAQAFGVPGDRFTPSDYDGDGKTDRAVFRNGVWWIFQSASGTVTAEGFGSAGDVPVLGDYDGDGKGDLCVFRNGVWWLKKSSGGAVSASNWGAAGDKPLTGDFDGDGKSDLAIFRASLSEWWISRSSNGTFVSLQFGIQGDVPVPADYDGDNLTNIAVYRPSEGRWYTSTDVNNNYYGSVYWGIPTDVPVPGDYDGDGKDDIAVYRNGSWFVRNSATLSMSVINYGLGGDRAVPNLYQ